MRGDSVEVQFECVYQDTEAQLRELYKMMYKPNRKWILLYAGLTVIFAGSWFAGGRTKDLIFAVFSLIWMGWGLAMPFRRARKAYRERLSRFNGDPPESRIQFGDQIRYRDGDTEICWPYRSVKNIYVFKDSIALEDHSKMLIQFPKSNFTKGAPAELLEFLKALCPQLDIPDWKW